MGRLGRFLIRLAKVLGVVIAVVVVAHTVATIVTGRMLAREIQRIKDAGEPLSIAQAAPKAVPGSQNAAVLYDQVYRKMRLSTADLYTLSNFFTFNSSVRNRSTGAKEEQPVPSPRGGRTTWPTPAEITAILDRNAEAIALIEAASRRPKCVFPVDWTADVGALVDAMFPRFTRMKGYARLLIAKAELLAVQGKPDEALAVCRTMLRMSEHVGFQPMLLAQLTRISLQAMTTSTVRDVLRLSSPSPEACRSTFDAIARIDDREGMALALKGERTFALERLRDKGTLGAGMRRWPPDTPRQIIWVWRMIGNPAGRYLLRPVLLADEARLLRAYAQEIERAKQPYRPRPEADWAERPSAWHPVSSMLRPVYDRGARAAAKAEALLGLAQVGLAAKAYEVKAGAYPDSLADLEQVIDWPLREDPFSGEPFVYRREGEGFLAYSVGPNLKDDGGKAGYGALTQPDVGGDMLWQVER